MKKTLYLCNPLEYYVLAIRKGVLKEGEKIMELLKSDERVMKADVVLSTIREYGGETKHVGEWDKWVELNNGIRYQAKMDVYEIVVGEKKSYMASDELGYMATKVVEDKQEVMDWLRKHGYKADERWYKEDCGMSEDAWEEWNR